MMNTWAMAGASDVQLASVNEENTYLPTPIHPSNKQPTDQPTNTRQQINQSTNQPTNFFFFFVVVVAISFIFTEAAPQEIRGSLLLPTAQAHLMTVSYTHLTLPTIYSV